MVERVCGTPQETFLQVAETLLNNSGADKTSSIIYAVGWTQHVNGVQMIRAAAILQALLGNIGRPGGGVQALRGHAQVQGATDISTLYHSVPGYLGIPSATAAHDTLKDFILAFSGNLTSFWSNYPSFVVSWLKGMYGDAATKENDFGYDYHPKIMGDHSTLPMFVAMSKGQIKGFFVMGQNPAVGMQNARLVRKALANLDWLVVRDLYETETAAFWRTSPEVKAGELDPKQIKTEVFLLPAAAVAEADGSFTNTGRLIQWHDKAADPPGDARTDTWFTFHLGKRLKEMYKDSPQDRDWGIKNLLWNYEPDADEVAPWRIKDEPSAVKILKEINGYATADIKDAQGNVILAKGAQLTSFTQCREDGTTICGAWIYSGVFPNATTNRAASRKPSDYISPGWGFAWPANRHIMYNRASANANGEPWSEKKKLVWWDKDKKVWTGVDGEIPDFAPTKAPDAKGNDTAIGLAWQNGTDAFIMKPDGKAWLFAPSGLVDGPLPTHYEPMESPIENNPLYKQRTSPVVKVYDLPDNQYHKPADPKYPIVLSTYRLTEHHLSGTMTRWLPWLAELMPELFCEISPELAAEKGIKNGEFVKVKTARGEVKARALVTRRMRPFQIDGKTVHEIGMPWHWGYQGHAVGDVPNNLSAIVGEPNVTIHEAKAFTCDIEAVKGGA
jgi:formate dehydrogenase major subunit